MAPLIVNKRPNQDPIKKPIRVRRRNDSVQLPDLGSSVETNREAAIEWKKNLSSPRELNIPRELHHSTPRTGKLPPFRQRNDDILEQIS